MTTLPHPLRFAAAAAVVAIMLIGFGLRQLFSDYPLAALSGVLLLGAFVLLTVPGGRQWAAPRLPRWVNSWCAIPLRWRLLISLALLAGIFGWGLYTLSHAPFAYSPSTAVRTASGEYGWAPNSGYSKDTTLLAVFNGLQHGCLLCGAYTADSPAGPIENFVLAEDLGLAFLFGLAAKTGVVSPSLSGYRAFILSLILAGVLLAVAVVGWSYRSPEAAVLFALALLGTRLLTPPPVFAQDILVRTYWVGAWVSALVTAWTVALLTPLAKRRSGPKPGAAGLCAAALGLTAGIGYLARSESGYLALLFAGLLLLYYSLRCDSWRLRGAVWLGLAAGFLLPVLAFRLTMEMRTVWYDLPPVKPDSFASHGIWHNALIGLGYVSNRWGLEWSDDNGWRFAQEHCPGVGFATPQYFACLRDGFFRIVWSDPGLLVRNLATKSVMMLAWLLTLPVALWAALGVVTARPRPTLVWLLIWTLVSLLPGLLAIPDYVYIQAFLCAVVCLGAISVLEYRT